MNIKQKKDAETNFAIKCDSCDQERHGGVSYERTRAMALGWEFDDGDRCPKCSEQRARDIRSAADNE